MATVQTDTTFMNRGATRRTETLTTTIVTETATTTAKNATTNVTLTLHIHLTHRDPTMALPLSFLKHGELRYKGRRVNPQNFDSAGKDLRRLVGKCQTCGCTIRGKAAVPSPDGYNSDLNGDYTPVVQCEDCNSERAQDL